MEGRHTFNLFSSKPIPYVIRVIKTFFKQLQLDSGSLRNFEKQIMSVHSFNWFSFSSTIQIPGWNLSMILIEMSKRRLDKE